MTENAHRFLFGAAALALLFATLLDAYGTHGLRDTLTAAAWDSYETAIAYQFYHGLGLIRSPSRRNSPIPRSCWGAQPARCFTG